MVAKLSPNTFHYISSPQTILNLHRRQFLFSLILNFEKGEKGSWKTTIAFKKEVIIAVFSLVSLSVTFIANYKSMKIQYLFESLLNMYYSVLNPMVFMACIVLLFHNFINKIKSKIKVEGIARRIVL